MFSRCSSRLPVAIGTLLCVSFATGLRAQTSLEIPAATPLESADPAESCDNTDAPTRERGSWYLVWENDAVAVGSGSDEAYTQGMRLGYDYGTGAAPRWLRTQAGWLCKHANLLNLGQPAAKSQWSTGVFIGQNMFTPGSISEQGLIADDRPYAAWLHLGERFTLRSEIAPAVTNYHHLELQVGLVGPQAQGEWVQTQFHKLIGDELPMGWDNQLPDEYEIFADYRFQQRRTLLSAESPAEVDWFPGYEVGLGTLQDYLEGSVAIRIGRGLGEPPFGNLPARIPMMVQSRTTSGAEPRTCLNGRWIFAIEECFIYARISGRATALNVFLDGTNWSDSHRVDRDPFYHDWAVGFRLRWTSFELDYEFVRRSREFSPVPATAANRDGHHDYGSINAHCRNGSSWACPAFFLSLLTVMAFQ
jgi:lipid A 3-O-deacylase